jgi:hypothetical protein
MFIRTPRFVVIMLLVVSAAAAIAHLLELPAKVQFDAALWLTLLQSLYPPAFGPVAGSAEAAAVVGSIVLAIAVRARGATFRWAVLAAACLAIAHACFWIWVVPVNAAMLPLTAETLPSDWMQLRDQWEYTHAVRAVLEFVALAALVLSLLVETPLQTRDEP